MATVQIGSKILTNEQIERYRRIFNLFDINKDGVLDARELGAVGKVLGYQLPKRDVVAMLKRLDIDKNRNMSFDEFLRAVSGNLPPQSEIQKQLDYEPEVNYSVPRFYSKPEMTSHSRPHQSGRRRRQRPPTQAHYVPTEFLDVDPQPVKPVTTTKSQVFLQPQQSYQPQQYQNNQQPVTNQAYANQQAYQQPQQYQQPQPTYVQLSQPGYQSQQPNQTGYQSPPTNQTGYLSPQPNQAGYQSPTQQGYHSPQQQGSLSPQRFASPQHDYQPQLSPQRFASPQHDYQPQRSYEQVELFQTPPSSPMVSPPPPARSPNYTLNASIPAAQAQTGPQLITNPQSGYMQPIQPFSTTLPAQNGQQYGTIASAQNGRQYGTSAAVQNGQQYSTANGMAHAPAEAQPLDPMSALHADDIHKHREALAAFEQFDVDGNGYITKEEAHRVLHVILGFTESQTREFISQCDVNTDGKLCYAEFVNFYEKVKSRKVAIDEAFRKFDAQGKGYVTVNDARRILGNFMLTDGEIERLVRMHDTNQDGVLQYEEFMTFWTA